MSISHKKKSSRTIRDNAQLDLKGGRSGAISADVTGILKLSVFKHN